MRAESDTTTIRLTNVALQFRFARKSARFVDENWFQNWACFRPLFLFFIEQKALVSSVANLFWGEKSKSLEKKSQKKPNNPNPPYFHILLHFYYQIFSRFWKILKKKIFFFLLEKDKAENKSSNCQCQHNARRDLEIISAKKNLDQHFNEKNEKKKVDMVKIY